MTFESIQADIRKGNFEKIYFLHGRESFFIDALLDELYTHVIPADQSDFNVTTVYGGETSGEALLPILRRYPMMSDRQLVVLKEAQAMRDFEHLEAYIDQPSDTTVFAIAFKNKSPDKRKTFTKKLFKAAAVFESKQLYDNQIPEWIHTYLQTKDRKINKDTAVLLAEYLGTDLSKISNELDKLLLNLDDQKLIDNEDVETYIGISKEFNIFELQSALAMGSTDRIFRIIHHFVANPKNHPIQLLTASLNTFFTNIGYIHLLPSKDPRAVRSALRLPFQRLAHEYLNAAKLYSLSRIYHIGDVLLEYDAKSKGYGANNTPPEQLIVEMMIKILT